VIANPSLQPSVNDYATALEAPRQLFELYPNPRPQGAPPKKYRPLPAAVVLMVTSSFEGFAENLLAVTLIRQGYGWAHIAQNADLTNPSVKSLQATLLRTTGIDATPAQGWTLAARRQSRVTGWNLAQYTWDELLTRSEGWIQVRNCLSHGLATGLGSETWPGPSTRRARANQATVPTARDVLARTSKPPKMALRFWSAVECAQIFSHGAAVLAQAVATYFNETLDTSVLMKFDAV
jgi:hypothetical protein